MHASTRRVAWILREKRSFPKLLTINIYDPDDEGNMIGVIFAKVVKFYMPTQIYKTVKQ